jgi:hypothetical protein
MKYHRRSTDERFFQPRDAGLLPLPASVGMTGQQPLPSPPGVSQRQAMTEALLLTAVPIATHAGERGLTNASGFFFERDGRLYLVTSRHVLLDEPSGHHPDRIELVLHLPATALLQAFTPAHLQAALGEVEVGTPLLVVGFPLGFHDTLHHLPVVRQAVIASSFGVRFQGQGYFLTDARTHRGTSGAAVVMRVPAPAARAGEALPWKLLGVHSGRLDLLPRDVHNDEVLGLNCAWYADILLTLTEPRPPTAQSATASR